MKKRILAICLVVAMAATAIVGASMAYLTDTDSDVNVMTLGNISIKQSEYERVVDENGNFVTVDTTNVDPNYGYEQAYKLQEFTQGKAALPAVYTNGTTAWDEFQQLWNQVGAPGSNDLFDDSMKNVIDKFVFVENDGKTDAYYRTIVAIEDPEGVADGTIHTSFNANSRFDYNDEKEGTQNSADANKFYIEINGTRYLVYVATYTEVLTPGEVSRPSLLQLFLDPDTTNEDCALFGDTWDVLVFSQAVQADGFDNADEALDAAFGDISELNHPWTNGITVSDMVSLEAALANGGTVILGDDIAIPDGQQILVPVGSTATLNLNGHSITSPAKAYGIRNEGNLTITGGGTIKGQFGALGNYGNAVAVVENTTLISNGYPASSSHAIYTSGNSSLTLTNVTVHHEGAGADGSVLYAAGNSTVVINSGNFTWSDSAYNLAAAGTSTVTINGGTFQNDKFFTWGGTIIDNRTNS